MRGGAPRAARGPRAQGPCTPWWPGDSPNEAAVDRSPHCRVLGISRGGGEGNPTWLNSGLGAREEQWIPAEQEPSPTQCLKLLPPQPAPLQSLRAG